MNKNKAFGKRMCLCSVLCCAICSISLYIGLRLDLRVLVITSLMLDELTLGTFFAGLKIYGLKD